MEIFKSNKSKVEELVEKALGASQTYREALLYIDATPWTVEGSLLRDDVREKIKKKALDSQIRLIGIQGAKSEEATEDEHITFTRKELCDDFLVRTLTQEVAHDDHLKMIQEIPSIVIQRGVPEKILIRYLYRVFKNEKATYQQLKTAWYIAIECL